MKIYTDRKKLGYTCAEAVITLPLMIFLTIVIIFVIVGISSNFGKIREFELTEDIRKADSIKRKADMVFEAFLE